MRCLLFLLGSFSISACASTAVPGGVGERVDIATAHPSAAPIAPSATCDVTTSTEPAVSRDHQAPCQLIGYPYVPPVSGNHYSIWANYTTYDAPVPWGFLVHSMEHGAIVLAYDPASVAATDIRAAFAAVISAHGADPICRAETWTSRIIVVPAHDLRTPLAALAWEHTYEATCIDMPSLLAFVDARYGHAPEAFCGAGEDASRTGWCS